MFKREDTHKRVVEAPTPTGIDHARMYREGTGKRVVEGADPYRFDHTRACREVWEIGCARAPCFHRQRPTVVPLMIAVLGLIDQC